MHAHKQRELTEKLVRQVEEHGYTALVLTVDTPFLGRRENDLRNSFHLSDGTQPLSYFLSVSRSFSFTLSHASHSLLTFLPSHSLILPGLRLEVFRGLQFDDLPFGLQHFVREQLDSSLTWKDLGEQCSLSIYLYLFYLIIYMYIYISPCHPLTSVPSSLAEITDEASCDREGCHVTKRC